MIRLIFAIMISAMALSASAQSKIDNLIEKFEKRNDVETTYTERRTPKRQLYKVSKILIFRDQGYYNQLVKAFEDERDNSVSAVKTSSQITYKFQNKKGTSTYTLTRDVPYTLVMTWQSNGVRADDDAFNEVGSGSSTIIINGKKLTSYETDYDEDDCCGNESDWQYLVWEINDISNEMDCLDRSRKSDCRRYVNLERKRAKLQKKLASRSSYQIDIAREQARQAREQAAIAREQAAVAREQAAVAREQAAAARERARYATSGNGSSTSTTTVYYNY